MPPQLASALSAQPSFPLQNQSNTWVKRGPGTLHRLSSGALQPPYHMDNWAKKSAIGIVKGMSCVTKKKALYLNFKLILQHHYSLVPGVLRLDQLLLQLPVWPSEREDCCNREPQQNRSGQSARSVGRGWWKRSAWKYQTNSDLTVNILSHTSAKEVLFQPLDQMTSFYQCGNQTSP